MAHVRVGTFSDNVCDQLRIIIAGAKREKDNDDTCSKV